MREILFRGKSPLSGKWLYGVPVTRVYGGVPLMVSSAEYDDDGIVEFNHGFADANSIGQFTGLFDKNGKSRIFEGDILKCVDGPNIEEKAVVRFGLHTMPNCNTKNSDLGFYLEWIGDEWGTLRQDVGFWSKKCEVIGNIHDNPDLLNEGGLTCNE